MNVKPEASQDNKVTPFHPHDETVKCTKGRNVNSRSSELTEPRIEGIVQEMYDSNATEKPNATNSVQKVVSPFAAKREIAIQISQLVIPSNQFARELPMEKASFLICFNEVLNEFERKEISNLAAGSVIYYAGDIPKRELLASRAEPMRELDDEEGYYRLIINDHIQHRY